MGLDIHVAVGWLMSLRSHHVWLLARRPGEQTSVLDKAHVHFHPKRFVLSPCPSRSLSCSSNPSLS